MSLACEYLHFFDKKAFTDNPRWAGCLAGTDVLFEHPILTRAGRKRLALVLPVGELAAALNVLGAARGVEIEHIYNY